MQYIEEEMTLAELANRFLHLDDFSSEEIYDLTHSEIEIETIDTETKNKKYVPVKNFIVKPSVDQYYTDGNINVTGNHIFVENGIEIQAKDHPDFKLVTSPMKVVDIEVDSNDHTYLANGRLNHNTTAGGKALPFHASVRLRLKQMGQIKAKINGTEQVVGIKTRVTVIKNRMGPPLRSIDYDIYFDSGIDNYGGWLGMLKDLNIVKQAGAWYTYEDIDTTTGEVINDFKFQSKDFISTLIENPDPKVKERLYMRICEGYIFKYQAGIDGGIDDVVIDDNIVNEEG